MSWSYQLLKAFIDVIIEMHQGVLMKFTSDESMKKYQKYLMTKLSPKLQPMFIERGEGCKLWDLEGNEYLDCWAGVAVMNIGHSHPAVTKAVQEQVGEIDELINEFNADVGLM